MRDGIYVVEGPKIEKMLGYTNLDSEKGFQFFQKFLKDSGILTESRRPASRRAIQSACTAWNLIIINRDNIRKWNFYKEPLKKLCDIQRQPRRQDLPSCDAAAG